jgi:aminoglycoside phosphotransferase (APT) family kinase protein
VELLDDPVRVTGGQDAAIWRVELADGSHHALRVFADVREPGFKRELEAMRTAAAGGITVPAVRASGRVEGYLAMLMEWCDGQPMLEVFSRHPWKLWACGRLLGREQARVHTVKPSAELQAGAPAYWLRRSGEGDPIANRLVDLGVRTDTLVHLDFHPLNVLMSDGALSGIIDWTNAAAGDSRADFALTASILNVAPVPPGPMRPILLRARRLFYGAWLGAYEKQAGKIDGSEIAPFMAWAGTVMLREAEPRAREGREWPTMDDLAPIVRWTDAWKVRAGLD